MLESLNTPGILTALIIVAVWLLLQFVLIRNSSLWRRVNMFMVIGLALAVCGLMSENYAVLTIGLVFAALGLARRDKPQPRPQTPPSTE